MPPKSNDPDGWSFTFKHPSLDQKRFVLLSHLLDLKRDRNDLIAFENAIQDETADSSSLYSHLPDLPKPFNDKEKVFRKEFLQRLFLEAVAMMTAVNYPREPTTEKGPHTTSAVDISDETYFSNLIGSGLIESEEGATLLIAKTHGFQKGEGAIFPAMCDWLREAARTGVRPRLTEDSFWFFLMYSHFQRIRSYSAHFLVGTEVITEKTPGKTASTGAKTERAPLWKIKSPFKPSGQMDDLHKLCTTLLSLPLPRPADKAEFGRLGEIVTLAWLIMRSKSLDPEAEPYSAILRELAVSKQIYDTLLDAAMELPVMTNIDVQVVAVPGTHEPSKALDGPDVSESFIHETIGVLGPEAERLVRPEEVKSKSLILPVGEHQIKASCESKLRWHPEVQLLFALKEISVQANGGTPWNYIGTSAQEGSCWHCSRLLKLVGEGVVTRGMGKFIDPKWTIPPSGGLRLRSMFGLYAALKQMEWDMERKIKNGGIAEDTKPAQKDKGKKSKGKAKEDGKEGEEEKRSIDDDEEVLLVSMDLLTFEDGMATGLSKKKRKPRTKPFDKKGLEKHLEPREKTGIESLDQAHAAFDEMAVAEIEHMTDAEHHVLRHFERGFMVQYVFSLGDGPVGFQGKRGMVLTDL